MADSNLLVSMLQNAAMLLVLVLVYVITSRPFATGTDAGSSETLLARVASGVLMGAIGILIISTPLKYSAGIIFDTRSVLISLAGLYFGWLPTLITMLITALYRLWLGGAALTGVLVIIASGCSGLLWRYRYRDRLATLGSFELLSLGLFVHTLMLLLLLTLPGDEERQVIGDVLLPVLFGFPLLTLLVGKLLSHFLHAEYQARDILDNAQRLSLAMSVSGQDLFELNLQNGAIRSISQAESVAKYPDRKFVDHIDGLFEQLHPEDVSLIQSLLRKVVEGELQEWKGDFRQLTRDGVWAWVHVAGRLVSKDPQGRPLIFLGTYLDITARKLAEEQLWEQANIDKITGLPNRSRFLEKLQAEIARGMKNNNRLALLYMDLDHFKEVNESMGHQLGDQLLQEVAVRLRTLARESDFAARIGGDEFIIILTELDDISIASDTADEIIAAIAQAFSLAGKQVYIGASVGITIYPEDGDSAEVLLRNADQAMYKAKEDGRNRYQFFTPAMHESVNRKTRILSELREALLRSALQVHYQPVVDCVSGRIVKAEALVRWPHPELGMVPPDTFIPLAETSGLIVPLGNMVLHEVLRAMDEIESCAPGIQVSVNKSPVQFSYSSNEWLAALAEKPHLASRLVVEITEGLLLDERPFVQTHLRQLQEAGVRIAIDDFGTGYSSLAYLKRFRVAFLKIDRSFIRNLAPGNEDHTLCEAMITMAHRLGIQVIAEGVETTAQRELLQAAGCDMAQGFLFAAAMPLADLLVALRAQSAKLHSA